MTVEQAQLEMRTVYLNATLRLTGRQGGTEPSNPLNALARQVAFIVPLLIPLAGAAAISSRPPPEAAPRDRR